MVAVQPDFPAPEHSVPTPLRSSRAGGRDCGRTGDPRSPVQRAEDIGRELRDLLDGAGLVPVNDLDCDERRRMLSAVNTITSRAKLLTARLVAAEAEAGDWAAEGDRTLEAWLGRHTGSGYGPAKSDVDMAQTLEDLPALGQALESGKVTVEHVRAASAQYTHGSDAQRESLSSPAGQTELVDKAGREDAGQFGKHLKQHLARIDAEKLERDRDAVRAHRYVKLSPRNGGVHVDGFLDPVAGEYLRTALDAAASRPAADDSRTGAQRRADALTAIAKQTLNSGGYKPGGQVRPHVMVTLGAAEWADWQRSGHVPSHAPAATIGDGVPLAPSEIDTLLCDCTIMRAVLDSDGLPVDLGRDKRTFKSHQRHALQLRDGHCTWPGCRMPGEYTEGHHIDQWADGGSTSIENGLLLCSFHHHYAHAERIVISPIMGGHRFTRPDGRIVGEHQFERHDPPPAWAVSDAKPSHATDPPGLQPDPPGRQIAPPGQYPDPSGRQSAPPPQLPLE